MQTLGVYGPLHCKSSYSVLHTCDIFTDKVITFKINDKTMKIGKMILHTRSFFFFFMLLLHIKQHGGCHCDWSVTVVHPEAIPVCINSSKRTMKCIRHVFPVTINPHFQKYSFYVTPGSFLSIVPSHSVGGAVRWMW